MDSIGEIRPLHLHTIDSLCGDLIAGRPIGVGPQNTPFLLGNVHARSVLQWYTRNRQKWGGNLMAADAEAIADCIAIAPIPSAAATPVIAVASGRQLTLVQVRAHRFGGLHRFGGAHRAPEEFLLDLKAAISFFEGLNGCGKTSVLNAVVWALTGDLLRPQRAPESGLTEFDCEVMPAADEASSTTHRTAAVAPLPQPEIERPSGPVAIDTWVELTFEDESGQTLPVLRRAVVRGNRGKISEQVTGMESLGLDPVAARIGTVMAGMLPYIQLGGSSALGKAVAELTGLAPLALLARHAGKARSRLAVELTKERQKEIARLDEAYERSRTDLHARVAETPSLGFPHSLPAPSEVNAEAAVAATVQHFEALKSAGLAEAKQVLGDAFDPQQEEDRRNLEESIEPAVAFVGQLKTLSSAQRLAELGALTPADVTAAREKIAQLLAEAAALVALAQDPSRAARLRLYAAVSSWLQAHPDSGVPPDRCPVCNSALDKAVDPVTGQAVKLHLEQAAHGDAALVAQTLVQWGKAAAAQLAAELPLALQAEIRRDLPAHPGLLVQAALTNELWESEPFRGVLKALQPRTRAVCETQLAKLAPLPVSALPQLDALLPGITILQQSIRRLDTALRFASWRVENGEALQAVFLQIVGRRATADVPAAPDTLVGRLQRLHEIVEAVDPIRQALVLCDRLAEDLEQRKAVLARIAVYAQACAALDDCAQLGSLAEQQVAQLQEELQAAAVQWRDRIYLGSYPATTHELVKLSMETDGTLEFQVGSGGVAAPAQHVANASALRASLVGFYLAYWQHVLRQRGGLKLLLLDDPQELLDGDNRQRLADALAALAKEAAQLVVTTHDKRFAQLLVLAAKAEHVSMDHRTVHPPTNVRPTLQTAPSVADVQVAFARTKADENDAAAAREYASECRVFIEARLGDLFDDGAFPAASSNAQAPTLMDHVQRLRGAVNARPNELFRSPVITALARDPALADRSPALTLLNKAHHQHKATIQPAEVKACRDSLERLRRDVERAHEEFRLFLRRERLTYPHQDFPALDLDAVAGFSVEVRPNLVAFVRGATGGESQEANVGTIDETWFREKAFFFLRTQNFGFASNIQSVAVVEAIPSAVPDRHLVIARHEDRVYARRLLRPAESDAVALASETPDPRHSRPTLLFQDREVVLHKVVGVFFDGGAPRQRGEAEAVQIDGGALLQRIRSAHKVAEQSAVPLALPGQIALGGPALSPDAYDGHLDAYVALYLSDGTTIFKRIGERLRAPLSHVRQFESIGGLGIADVLAVDKPEAGFRSVINAVLIVGVLYHG